MREMGIKNVGVYVGRQKDRTEKSEGSAVNQGWKMNVW
jgi:hypothetical protein